MDYSEYFKNKDQSFINLNNGTLSLSPDLVTQAKHRHIDEYEKNPTKSLFQTWEKLWDVQKKLAGYFKTGAQDIFLRPNVTWAMNDLIMGFRLSPGSIAVTDLEYGAIVNICRLKAQREGLSLKVISLTKTVTQAEELTPDEVVQLILQQLPQDCRMLMLSHVMTGTGLVIPIQSLAIETKKRGVLLCVDGAHAPGALNLNFSELQDVDLYAGNLHKWFMAPKGTAFGWVHPRMQSEFSPYYGSWTVFESPAPFRGFGGGSRFAEMMLWSHCQDFSSFFAIDETIGFWQELGQEKVFSKLQELKSVTLQKMKDKGFNSLSPKHRELSGPLLAFKLPQHLKDMQWDLLPYLLRRGVQAGAPIVMGEFCLRLSPHIHNSLEEIERGLEIISSL